MGKPYWNDRRERFAQALASGHPSEEAGALVGYSGANSRRNANRPDVKARVAELVKPAQEAAAAKLAITKELLLAEAFDLYKQCVAKEAFSPAVAALKEVGVLSGFRVERSEQGEPNEFERMSDEELRKFILEGAQKLLDSEVSETQH